jgi:HEAT repeat protein
MENEYDLTIDQIMQALTGDEPVSIPMLYQLSDLNPDDMDQFCSNWSGLKQERRRVIIRHLADISEQDFQVDFSSVFSHCLGDTEPEVRKASLDGLWDTDRLSLIEPIIRVMENDPDNDVKALAAATLGHFVLMGEWQQIPYASIDPIVEALIAQVENENVVVPVRRAALESLGAASHPRVASLIEEAYDGGDPDMQISSVYAMGKSADKRWLPVVNDEMLNSTTEMRIEAARASGEIGGSDFVPNLAELVWDEDVEVQLAAVTALGEIGGELAMRILEELVEDPEAADIQDAVVEALEQASWVESDFDFSLFDWENDLDDETFPSA